MMDYVLASQKKTKMKIADAFKKKTEYERKIRNAAVIQRKEWNENFTWIFNQADPEQMI